MNKHAISIKWSDEDNGFIASIPGVAGLSAFGSTREIALSELKIAAGVYFEALGDAGKTLPSPETILCYSGQLRLRMPKSLHSELAVEAQMEGISLNTHIVTLLSERHIEKKLLNRIESIENTIVANRTEMMPEYTPTSQPTQKSEESRTSYKKK